jgi:hypothetical protein
MSACVGAQFGIGEALAYIRNHQCAGLTSYYACHSLKKVVLRPAEMRSHCMASCSHITGSTT